MSNEALGNETSKFSTAHNSALSGTETNAKTTASSVQSNVQSDQHQEREHLLRSLDDLDRERAAGDLDELDYETLRADYTARFAAILRQDNFATETESNLRLRTAQTSAGRTSPSGFPFEGAEETEETDGRSAAGGTNTDSFIKLQARDRNEHQSNIASRSRPSPARRIGVAVGVLGVAIGSGVAVARFAGERVGSTGLTGTVRQAASPQQQAAAKFMQVGRDNLGSDPIKSLQAFDAALKIDPTIAEAMAYSGWVLRIASLSAEGTDADDLRAGAIRRIDEAIIADPTYPDAYAFRGVIALRDQDDPTTALAAFKKLDGLQTPPFVQQLVGSARKEAEDALADPASTSDPTSIPPTS